MGHAIKRTSPHGTRFVGRCVKCGQEGLGSNAPLTPCPADHIVSDGQALMELVAPDPLKVKVRNKLRAMGRKQ